MCFKQQYFVHAQFTIINREILCWNETVISEYFQTYFRPGVIFDHWSAGIDGFLKDVISSQMQTVDRYVTRELNGLGTDVIARTIQQARDHGIPGMYTWQNRDHLIYQTE